MKGKISKKLEWGVIFFTLVVFISCGKKDEIKYKFSEDTLWVEKDTNWKLEEKEEDRLVFSHKGSAPDIKEGAILLSTEGEGYLRRVVSVDELGGGRIEVETEPASLTDAFEELRLYTTIQLQQNANLSPPGIFQAPLTIEGPTFEVFIPLLSLDEINGELEGSFGFTPSFEVDIDISWFKLKYFKLAAIGDITTGADLSFSLERGIRYTYEKPLIDYGGLISQKPIILFVKPIGPVVIVGKITMSGGIEFSAEGVVDGKIDYDAGLSISGGIEYKEVGGWAPISKLDYEFKPELSFNMYAQLETEVNLKPRIGIYFYDIAGPYFQLKPYGKGVITVPPLHMEAGLGLEGSIGGSVKVLMWKFADIDYQLFDFYEVLWERTFGCVTDTDCPDGYVCENGGCVQKSGESAKTNWVYIGFDLRSSRYNPNPSFPQNLEGFSQRYKFNATPTADWPHPLLVGDVNGDGINEVVFISSETLYILGPNGNALASFNVPNHNGVSSLEDIDNDGKLDIGTYATGGDVGKIIFYSYTGTKVFEFSKSVGYDGCIWPIFLYSGKLIVGNNAGYSLKPRGISVVNLTTKVEEWHYSTGPFSVYPQPSATISLSNGKIALWGFTPHNGNTGNGVDGNGTPTNDGQLYHIVIDTNGNEVFTRQVNDTHTDGWLFQRFLYDGNIVAVESHDPTYYWGTSKIHLINPTNGNDIITPVEKGYNVELHSIALTENAVVIGWRDGTLDVYSPMNLSKMNYANLGGEVFILAINDIDGDGALEVIAHNRSKIYVLSLSTLSEKWSYSPGETIRQGIVGDINGDGKMDIVIATEQSVIAFGG